MKINKKINQKETTGITLIALVITIIVLLILAGISISMLSGDNSILNQAGRARDITGEKSIAERVQIAYLGAAANGMGDVTPEEFKQELIKQFGSDKISDDNIIQNADGTFTVTIDGVEANAGGNGITPPPSGTSNLTDGEKTKLASNGIAELTGDAITNDNLKDTTKIKAVITGQVPIPDSATYEEGTVDTGVVIKYKNSEFVWVPVPNAIYNSSKYGNLPKSSATGSLTNTNYDYTPMAINIGTTAEPVYKGLLYGYNATKGAFLKYSSASPFQGSTSENREPAYLSGTSYDDNATYGGLFTDTDLQTSYNTMIQSVAKYGGFFIGRYETSYNGTQVASVSGVNPMSAETTSGDKWYGMYQKQKNFTTSTDKMQSEMIWGSQYDAMLNWAMKGADKAKVTAKSNGNHSGSVVTCGNSTYSADKINNIYDLEGNLFEWTQEAYDTNSRTNRGSSCNYSFSPNSRGRGPSYAVTDNGSRLSLYIK